VSAAAPEAADVFQTVKHMAEEVKAGRTPALLRQFLQETFEEQRPRGWLSQWLSTPHTYELREIELFQDGGFFRASCIFWLYAREHFLEGAVLPSGGTFGLFASGPNGLRYLHRRQQNIEELLRTEKQPLDSCEPFILACLLAEALGREKNSSHDVLRSADHLERYDGHRGGFGGGYAVDPKEWQRVRASLHPPVIAGSAISGWQLEFCSVFGWMHMKQTLLHHRVRFSPELRIELSQQVLSDRIFSAMPGIVY
jgi:hypothetical protein